MNLKIPFFHLLKETFVFVFTNKERLWHLTAFPMLFVVLLSVISRFIPSGMSVVSKDIIYPIFLYFVLLVLFVITMVQVHCVIFFGEPKSFFVPKFNKENVYYLYLFFKMLFASAVISQIALFGIYMFVGFFLPVQQVASFYVFIVALLCAPYFMIRFFTLLPASVAGNKVTLFEAWKKTKAIGLPLSVYYVTAFLFPLFIGMLISTVLKDLPFPFFVAFLQVAVSNVSLLFGCVMQAIFMTYLYLYLQKDEIEKGTDKDSILALAKQQETD